MFQTITFKNFEDSMTQLLGDTFKSVEFTPWKDQRNGKGWEATVTVDKQGFNASYFFDSNPLGAFLCDVDEYLAMNNPGSDDIQYYVPSLKFA